MAETRIPAHQPVAVARYDAVRRLTERLAEPLSPEDQTVQSMPDTSPTKWHRAHTSWFFETFVLGPFDPSYAEFDRSYAYLFNSYYEAVGPRHPRPQRGMITRPGAAEVTAYRRHVDEAMTRYIESGPGQRGCELVELGLHHEQQHQELLLMDIKHALSFNPLAPAYAPGPDGPHPAGPVPSGWVAHPGGAVEIGHAGGGFCFDNETPRHATVLLPFELSRGPVTNGDWMEFIADDGYRRPELWLSEGWAAVQANGWDAPLYWSRLDGDWWSFTLSGSRPVEPTEPVCHISLFEADAFARWAGARLPTEAEWEAVAASCPVEGNFLGAAGGGSGRPDPGEPGRAPRMFGDVWQWTSSAYSPYPGFLPAPGAVGEYNGKFMVNQYVLRGGSCVTPEGHVRDTYRNFFPASARWVFAGLRLARDL